MTVLIWATVRFDCEIGFVSVTFLERLHGVSGILFERVCEQGCYHGTRLCAGFSSNDSIYC